MQQRDDPEDREDVLASIRRVVGGDAEAGSDRLVLGADQRIDAVSEREAEGPAPLELKDRVPNDERAAEPRFSGFEPQVDGHEERFSDVPDVPLLLTSRRDTEPSGDPDQIADAETRLSISRTSAPAADTAEKVPVENVARASPGDRAVPDPLPREAADGMPDPDALRALIAEVVREELQGAMGERITRNLRKMVRREIVRMVPQSRPPE